jgi:hypothetical protein
MKKKPCPFCGGKRLFVSKSDCSWHDPPFAYSVGCAGADCHGHIFALGHDLFKTENEAIEAWNERAEGCTRYQTTTQYCAEAVEKDNEIKKLKNTLVHILDWAKKTPLHDDFNSHQQAGWAIFENAHKILNEKCSFPDCLCEEWEDCSKSKTS